MPDELEAVPLDMSITEFPEQEFPVTLMMTCFVTGLIFRVEPPPITKQLKLNVPGAVSVSVLPLYTARFRYEPGASDWLVFTVRSDDPAAESSAGLECRN